MISPAPPAFLALFVTLPTRQSAGRMRIWRALRALGCATLRDGVFLLPTSEAHGAALDGVAADARAVGGAAEIHRLDGRDDGESARLVGLFDRRAEYARLLAAIRDATAADARALRALRREFAALAAIDFFPGEAQRQVAEALADFEAGADGEPADAGARIRRLATADFQGRTWATRKRLWVDRIASAWLIVRFIDAQPTFLWLDDPKKCPKKALGFDFDGAAFTHVDGRVTFEVLMASFGLDADPALVRIADIVHYLDAGGVPVAEAAGIEAVLAGARSATNSDHALLAETGRLFDNLYQHFRDEAPHD